jgi:cellulose biosynthesis protein BcsQ
MNWRALISDVNLVWTTMGLAVAGLVTAFVVGRWWGAQTLRKLVSEKNQALAEKDREIAELNRKVREKVPDPSPPPDGLPPESVQVWLKPVAPGDFDLTGLQGRIPTLVIANLKGGVAKTMIAANLSAYFSKRANYPRTAHLLNKRVLLIDLDYQGSVSGMMMTATGAVPEHPNCQVKTLFDPAFCDDDALNYRVRLAGALPALSLYPATYGFDDLETREQFRWLAGQTDDDVRFRLLKRLRSPTFMSKFDLVVIDTGPRLTTGSVAALTAATHLLIPTSASRRDTEAAERFMRRVSVLKRNGLCPNLKLVGVVATLTKGDASGVKLAEDARNSLQAAVANDPDLGALISAQQVVLEAKLPQSLPIVGEAEKGLPYLESTSSRTIFNAIGAEIEQRMT